MLVVILQLQYGVLLHKAVIWHVVDSFLKLVILVFLTDDSLSSRVLDSMEGS